MREIDLTARSDETTRELLGPAALALKDGHLVIIPTSTYYALAADAMNPAAVRRVFAAKKRDPSKPLIALVDSFEMMRPLVREIPPLVKELEWRLGSRGLSYVLTASPQVPSELTGGTGTVAVRIERNEIVQELLGLVGGPVTGPSANLEGQPPPTSLDRALPGLTDWVDVAVRWHPSGATAPSTVIDLTGAEPSLAREGTVPWDEVGKVAGDAS
jgi:L-threonylcarbamoyladenylate synthase